MKIVDHQTTLREMALMAQEQWDLKISVLEDNIVFLQEVLDEVRSVQDWHLKTLSRKRDIITGAGS